MNLDASAKLDSAGFALSNGDLALAERLCREILASHPASLRAHLLLGVVAQRSGRHAQAVSHFMRAHELEPSSFEAATGLATAYRSLGEIGYAAHFANIAVGLQPDDAHARTELGSIYLESMCLRAAEAHLRRAVDLSKGNSNARLMLAQCLEREGKLEEAARTAREGLQDRARSLDELSAFIGTMIEQRTPVVAAEGAAAALRLAPDSLKARALCARAMMEARRGSEVRAILDDPSLAQCAEREPQDTQALAILGMLLQSFGRLEEARHYLRRAVELPQPAAIAFYGYTHACRISSDDSWLVRDLEERLNTADRDDRTTLHFALGKAYEDLGEYGKAMSQYDAANLTQTPGELAGAPEFHLFTREFMEANRGHGLESDLPILVVGMLRSGTTLAEQILTSHPEIGGVGELPFWNDNATDLVDTQKGSLRKGFVREAAELYLSVLTSSAPGSTRVVDKMPANYNSLGLVHLALPNARFIHMRRNPLDTCISIYATIGAGLGLPCNSKRNLVDAYRRYLDEMAHWRQVLPPDRLLEIDYEDLVGDSEATIRRMLEFLGLDWDDACLSPESNPRAVATPTLWQVRKPINKGSVNRWRRFEPYLGEFAELA